MNIENISLKPAQVLEQNQERANPESSSIAYAEILTTLNKQAEEVESASTVQSSKSQVEIWKKEREKCLEEYRTILDEIIEKYGSEDRHLSIRFFLLASGEDVDFEKYGKLLLDETYDANGNKINPSEEQIAEFLGVLKEGLIKKRQECRQEFFDRPIHHDILRGMLIFFFATEADLQTGDVSKLVGKDSLENMSRLREILMEHIQKTI